MVIQVCKVQLDDMTLKVLRVNLEKMVILGSQAFQVVRVCPANEAYEVNKDHQA